MEIKAQAVADILKTIANKHRLLILCSLEEGEKTVSELHCYLPTISMSALSQHLSALKLSQMVKREKRGLHVYYQIQDERILRVIQVLKDTYCNDM